MKPNYDEMTKAELRVYILEHRDDLDAIEVFFARRSLDSEATLFPPPRTEEEWQQQLKIVRPILEQNRKTEQ